MWEELLLEDSVSITTEKSFNSESKTFSAKYPLELSFIMKDFKENDTWLEYIWTKKQQMWDGWFIMQITDESSWKVVWFSDSSMKCLVIHTAPLDKSCENDENPIAGKWNCLYTSIPEPYGWKNSNYNISSWDNAIEYSESQVSPKDWYDKINWDSSAKLVWWTDLETDNTILCKITIESQSNTETSHSHWNHEELHSHFSHFDNVLTGEDEEYLVVNSDWIANHNMMVWIKSWQQQVPVIKDYSWNNSWKIPLNPEIAETPISTAEHFHKWAIALAVNWIPIFNALNNRWEYAQDVGELDKWGWHSWKWDDYHYHLAPTFLEEIVGEWEPVAYVLDGFPLYWKTDEQLDENLGRFNENWTYQYHAVDYAPYLVAWIKWKVEIDSLSNAPEDQIVPQGVWSPVRTENYWPLNWAEVTWFEKKWDNSYSLEYTIKDEKYYVNYSWTDDWIYTFEYIDADWNTSVKKYNKSSKQENNKDDKITPLKDEKIKDTDENTTPKKFCWDNICDNTESIEMCPVDCK